MLQLTHPDYFLPVIQALEAGRILQTGRTKPMIIRGVCTTTGYKGEYVVKLKGSDQMWQGSSLNEILGSYIASALGFLVPEPVIVNITDEFVETMANGHDNYGMATRSVGYNFGTALENGYRELVQGQAINEELSQKLINLFALDILIGNPDRRIDKPNFLTNGKDLLIYDHELAFSFTQVFAFARNPEPWMIPDTDMNWIANNYCYTALKRGSFDFSNFTDRLSVINEEFWNKAHEIIPDEWQHEHFEVIKTHIDLIIANKEIFASELNRILL